MDTVTALPASPTFAPGAVCTRREIRAALGGGTRAALPTRAGRVTCLCVTREMNPGAPGEILVPARPVSLRLARALAGGGVAVPVFVRRRAREWECAGDWRVRALVEEPRAVAAHAAASGRADVGLVLLMEEQPHPASTAAPPPGAAGEG